METSKFTPEQNKFIEAQRLSEEQLEASIQQIILKLKETATPSESPIAVIVGGQCGAGKSGVIGDTIARLGSNCVVIDNDNYRYAHPNVAEINDAHPELFTECTDQLSFKATPRAIASMIDGRYNMIIHQTLKNDTIVRCAITDLLNAGYTVVVRALAVDKITSIRDELRRGQGEIEAGRIARWVPPENHDTAYNGLPGTVATIESQGKYHLLEIITRSEDENNHNAINIIHRAVNPDADFAHRLNLRQNNFETERVGAYPSAEAAVHAGRAMDAERTMATIDDKLEKIKAKAKTPEEKLRVKRIESICMDYVMPQVAKKQPGEGEEN